MWLLVLIVVVLGLVLAWFRENTADDLDDCAVCCIGVKKNSLAFVNLKGVGWTSACPHCVNVHGIDETPEGRKISITIPYWTSQPAKA